MSLGKTITLAALKKGSIKRSEFKDFIQSNIGNETCLFISHYTITYQCLKLISDLRVNKTNKSVSKNAKIVLQSMFSKVSDTDENYPKLFVRNVLDFIQLPIYHKQILNKVTKRDLAAVDELLNHYNSIPFIEEYTLKRSQPRNHQQRTILEFYNRTLKKRGEIVDYLLYKIDARSIEKAKEAEDKWDSSKKVARYMQEYQLHKDFPYRDEVVDFKRMDFAYKINFQKIDYRKINLIANKSFSIRLDVDRDKGYTKKFYRIVNRLPLKQILKNTIGIVKDTPILNERLPIFKELNSLYNQKHWHGFYALALPQVEGIFAEMIKASKPNAVVTGTLTDKVQMIRPFYSHSSYSFDYYEFHLPEQRNHFSHTGKVIDVKNKCNILLLDLQAVVNVFIDLDSPIIKLNRIIQNEGISSIHDIGRLANFIYTIEQVIQNGHFTSIEKKCTKFINEEILQKIDFISFLKNLEIDFELAFKKYSHDLALYSSVFYQNSIDTNELFDKDLSKKIKVMQEVHDHHSLLFQEELKLVIDTNYVLGNIEEFFAGLNQDVRNSISAFNSKFKYELKVVSLLNSKLKMEIPDDFILNRNKHKHYSIPKS